MILYFFVLKSADWEKKKRECRGNVCPSESTRLYKVKCSVLHFVKVLQAERGDNMAYGIMRMSKVKMGGVTGIQIHNLRQKDHSNTNPDIDWSRTEQNYEIYAVDNHSQNFKKAIQERIDDLNLKRKPRKDATVMVDVLVTASPDFFQGDNQKARDYFEKAYEQIADRFGWDNIISAEVHMDEATPHMHIDFVPFTKDGRLSAKDVLGSPKDFHELQDWFHEKVSSRYGLERGETQKGEKPRKHLDMMEYKIASLDSDIQDKQNSLLQYQQTLENMRLKKIEEEDKLRNTSERLSEAQNSILTLKGEQSALESENKALKSQIEENKQELLTTKEVKEMDIPVKRNPITKKEKVELTPDEYKKLKATAEKVDKLQKEIKPARKIKKQEKQIIEEAEKKADDIIKAANDTVKESKLKKAVNEKKADADIQNQLRAYKRFFENNPDIQRRFEDFNRTDKKSLSKAL